MKLEGSFLQSKVARRMFALFVLTALIPVAFLSVFSYRQVTQLLTEQTRRELATFSASYGAATYERLLLAERLLNNLAAELVRDPTSQRVQALSAPVFQSLTLVRANGGRQVVFGTGFDAADFGDAEMATLRRGESLLLKTDARGGYSRGVGMARLADAAKPQGDWVAGEVSAKFLWGNADELPYLTQVCMIDAQKALLYCSSADLRQAVQTHLNTIAAQGTRATLTLPVAGETHLAAMREVFVASHFGKKYWVVIASRPEAEALAPVTVFRTLFWGAVVLAGLVVLLLSGSQIRRTLVPLENLMAATRRVAQRDFSQPVVVDRADEFGELARTFNYMSNRLDRQFNVLATLSHIDRSILSDLNVTQVIDAVLSRLPEVVKAQWGAIFVLHHDAQAKGEMHWAAGDSVAHQCVPAELSDAARARLLEHRTGLWAGGAQADALRELFGLGALRAQQIYLLPVMWQARLCGALLLGWHDAVTLEDADLAHVRDFADRVGVTLSSSAREAKLFYQPRYDALTDLPNRYLFTERVAQEIARAQREGRRLVLLFIALDRFKNVSDALGHAAGDALIREAAARLRKQARTADTLCRFGGQEFALLLSGDLGPKQAEIVAQHVIATLSVPFVIDGVESFITASVGIALYPEDGANAADLLRNADTACARASGHNTFVYFTESMNQRAVQRASLERDLRRGIDEQQFLLFYQPKIDFASRRIMGAEALLRWRHPQRGMVNPGAFIEVAEDTGLIVELGRFALEAGCRQFAAWRDEGLRLEHVAVNISSRQFRAPRVVEDVRTHMAAHGLGHGELELEVTESVMVDNVEDATRILNGFRQHGARIALDDFGTGYSSMRYLESLPFDTLKIDMSFVRPIKDAGEGGAIAAAIIALARSLNKEVVAEGVETEAQAAFLRAQGCHIAQGYLYGKPLPAQEFAALYRTWTPLQ